MAKNYVSLYEGGNDSIALEQKIFIKKETVRGQLVTPAGTDFIYHLDGGSVNFSQDIESAPHKSGRHHTSVIKQKTSTEWTLPTFFNIDESLGAAAVGEIDSGVRVLHESMFGKQDISGGSPVYTSENPPSITFSIYEVGDVWAKQCPGAFVESCNMTFPGDGQAQAEWSGMAKTVFTVGMGKSITANAANAITLAAGEGKRFPVGSKVMIIKDDNTKSADTPAGSARTVTAVAGDVVTVDGAVLADADGTVDPVYLCYYEPEGATAINNPVTGLVGSITLAGFPTVTNCVRTFSLNCTNNHEVQDFCYGETGLGGKLFVPGGRLTCEASMEINMSKELVGFINGLTEFTGEDVSLVLGDASGRHLLLELPKIIFPVPEISVPESGTIPVTLTGNAYQTALDAADEVTVSYL
jgi:hypothetical protein